MRLLKGFLIAVILILVALSAFYFFWVSPRYVVPILMYHRFGYDGGSLFVTPENFERQMAYLKENKYNVISLDELVTGIKYNRKFDKKTLVITIDDGYEDNFIYAYPVLKRYNFPVTIFIVADAIGQQKYFMDWQQVKTMGKDNISFGGHTRSGKYLPIIKNDDHLRDEIAGCKKVIEENLKRSIDYFCYPTGGFTPKIKLFAREAGYKGACTTNRGLAQLNTDLYELKRVKVKNSDTNKPFSFPAKLSGYYNIFRSNKAGH